MKRVLIITILSLVFVSPAFAQTSAVSGTVNTLGGAAPTDQAVVRFSIENVSSGLFPRVVGTGSIITKPFDFTVTAGTFSGTIFQNDEITPAGTFYNICLIVNRRETGCNIYEINGTTFNLDSATPLGTLPVVTAPTGDTTYLRLDGGNIMTGNILGTASGQNLGALATRWDLFGLNIDATTVGIGIASPTVPLHVFGGGNNSAIFDNDADATNVVEIISGSSAIQAVNLKLSTFGGNSSTYGIRSNGKPFINGVFGVMIEQLSTETRVVPEGAGDSVALRDNGLNAMFTCTDVGTVGDCKTTGVSILADTGTLAASTTPSVAAGNIFNTNSTASITDFTGGVDGQIIYLLCGADTTTSLTDSTPLFIAGAFTCTADDSITLLFDGAVWTEISRSVN